MLRILLYIILAALGFVVYSAYSDYSSVSKTTTAPPVKTNPSLDLSKKRDEVKNLFISDEEKTAIDAVWAKDTIFKVGVIADGSSRDGYANYVCETLYDYGFKGQKVFVSIIDIVKLKREGDWVELGKAYCS